MMEKFIKALPLTPLLLVLLITHSLSGQDQLKYQVSKTNCPEYNGEADIWQFGQNAGIDFSGGQATPITGIYDFNVPQGSAVISDSMGNLLFYTNGQNVWDRNRRVMPNGSNLGGNMGATQPAIIVPRPGVPDIYYIFTVDLLPFFPGDTTKNGFSYSEVDLRLNNGFGDVTTTKKVNLIPQVSSKVTAVRHSNGRDVWVIAHQWESNQFCAYLVTEAGVDENCVTTNIGTLHTGDLFTNNSAGYMKVSPDGSKLAIAIYGMGIFEIFDFNTSSGKLSNAITSPDTFKWAYGVAFSPDGSKLYGSTAWRGGEVDSVSTVYQFDVFEGNAIFNDPDILAQDFNGNYYTGMQLAPDGRIYIARGNGFFGSPEISVIYNPNRPGAECNLDLLDGGNQQFSLAGYVSSLGMPNFIQSYFDRPHFDVDSICYTDGTQFYLQNEANVNSISWNFGDGSTSTDMTPVHVYDAEGDYTVTVTENGTYTYSETITVRELPYIELPDTIYMYPGSPIRLNAGEGFKSYLWSNGETGSFITVDEPGVYWAQLENQYCCFNYDSVTVLLFEVLVPNAFRPGGVNSEFRATATADVQIDNFQLMIYNRWGQMIFESKDIGSGWDGKFNGKEVPGGVYVWQIKYSVERDGGNQAVNQQGSLVLLR